jgi:AcrR family transcriptional regulator
MLMPQKIFHNNTKSNIFHSAVQLFSKHGFTEVSVRDIAFEVGIKVSSLYNHFSSKEEILKTLYDYYNFHWEKSCPDILNLLTLAETIPPGELLMMLDFRFPNDIHDTMDRILKIAIRHMGSDAVSEEFIREHVMGRIAAPITLLLDRLTVLGRIEPINLPVFIQLLTNYAVSTALLNHTFLQTDLKDWRSGLEMVFSLVKEKRIFLHESTD